MERAPVLSTAGQRGTISSPFEFLSTAPPHGLKVRISGSLIEDEPLGALDGQQIVIDTGEIRVNIPG